MTCAGIGESWNSPPGVLEGYYSRGMEARRKKARDRENQTGALIVGLKRKTFVRSEDGMWKGTDRLNGQLHLAMVND